MSRSIPELLGIVPWEHPLSVSAFSSLAAHPEVELPHGVLSACLAAWNCTIAYPNIAYPGQQVCFMVFVFLLVVTILLGMMLSYRRSDCVLMIDNGEYLLTSLSSFMHPPLITVFSSLLLIIHSCCLLLFNNIES